MKSRLKWHKTYHLNLQQIAR